MNKQFRLLFVVAALIAVLVSACGGAMPAGTSAGSDKPLASLVEFTGVIEAMDGNQWTINGQTITVDPAVLRDGPFAVGDTVKVEAEVQADGTVVVTRVEAPALATDDPTDANDNTNTVNSNLDNANLNSNDNTNSSDINGNTNDDDDDDDDSNSNGDDEDDDDNSNGDDDEDDDDSNTNG